jgi:hypothetical protein
VPAKYVYDAMFQAQNLGQGFAGSTMMLLTVLIVLIPWAYHGIRRQETWLMPEPHMPSPPGLDPAQRAKPKRKTFSRATSSLRHLIWWRSTTCCRST